MSGRGQEGEKERSGEEGEKKRETEVKELYSFEKKMMLLLNFNLCSKNFSTSFLVSHLTRQKVIEREVLILNK